MLFQLVARDRFSAARAPGRVAEVVWVEPEGARRTGIFDAHNQGVFNARLHILAAYGCTRFAGTVNAIAPRVETGTMTINHFAFALPDVTFRGVNDCGHGWEAGSEAIRAYPNRNSYPDWAADCRTGLMPSLSAQLEQWVVGDDRKHRALMRSPGLQKVLGRRKPVLRHQNP